MKSFLKIFSLLSVAFACTACDDNTAMIGMEIMPDGTTEAEPKTFPIETKTVVVDAVLANTSTCYLGCVVDPELQVRTTSDFLAQFHIPENFSLPKKEKMITNEHGEVIMDSCDIRIYFEEYYGDSLATMKMRVRELSREKIMEEGVQYYTNLNPQDFLGNNPAVDKSLTYAIKDLSRPDNETSGTTYYRQVAIKLDSTYAQRIANLYYSNPEYFKNSYQFIHHVCPGFYFEHTGGLGSMLTTAMMGMNLYFRYHSTTNEGNDTIVDGMQRLAATEEVIQNTRIANNYPDALKPEEINKNPYTFLKTPASLFTEINIPLTELIAGTHYNDSISQAKLSIRRFEKTNETKYPMAQPSTLLLIRKDKVKDFFEQGLLPDSKTSFLATWSTTAKVYQFANIAKMLTDMKNELDANARVTKEDDEATRTAKYEAWLENADPDWNKLMLIPVKADYTTTPSYYGQTINSLRSVRHELGLSSTKLEGGKDNPLNLEVIYTRKSAK